MPKFCANLSWLFKELPFIERFEAAKDAGFEAVEVLYPYDSNAQDIVNELARYELKMALINCPPPNYTGGEPGYAAVPALKDRFRRDFKRAARYARTLGAQHVHILAGVAKGAEAHEVFVENLRWAAAEAPKQSLTIEPINKGTKPGYFLDDFSLAREIIEAVGAPNLRLQFDTFHAARIAGDVIATWEAVRDLVAHVQIGQSPNRTDPNEGEIDFPAFFNRLDTDGYDGWVAAEYEPAGRTETGLAWMA